MVLYVCVFVYFVVHRRLFLVEGFLLKLSIIHSLLMNCHRYGDRAKAISLPLSQKAARSFCGTSSKGAQELTMYLLDAATFR